MRIKFKNDNFGSSVLIALGISGLGYFATFLCGVIIARLLGVEAKGLFSFFRFVVTTIAIFSCLGIGHGQIYYASKDPENIRHFLPNAYIISIFLIGGVALLFFITAKLNDLKIMADLGWPLIFMAIVDSTITSMLTFQGQYFLTIRAYKLAKTRLATTESVPLLAFGFIYLFNQVTIINMISAFLLCELLCIIFFHIVIRQSEYEIGRPSWKFAKNSFSFGIRQYSSDLVLYSVSRLDFFLVTYFLGQFGLGIYSVAVSLAEITMRLPYELGTMLFPAFAGGQVPAGQAAPILRKTFSLALLAALSLYLLGDRVILILFGSKFKDSIVAFQWLLPGTVAWSTIFVTWNYISASGRPELGIPIFGAAAILDVILNILLLPRVGVVGASMAATISYLLTALLFLMIFLKKEGCSLREALVPQYNDVSSFLARFIRIIRVS
jgi:O-antigen/teichoic acid export membrane protein